MIYITVIQMCLISLAVMVGMCELTPTFAQTFESMVVRFVLAICLICIGYYAQYLELLHSNIILVCFTVVVLITFLSIHFIGKEYLHRLRKIEKLEILKAQRNANQGD